MKYSAIPRFTRIASWHTDVDWKYLPDYIDRWLNPKDNLAKLDTNPDFQRGHVWTADQQAAYVEYILRGGMSGRDIYFNCAGWGGTYKGPFVLVDGKQRLEAVSLYLRNEITVFGGMRHSDFEDRLPSSAGFKFHVNDLPQKAQWLQWYLEMNTGGTPHTEAEINKVREMLKAAL
jgi:hypothetical protein